ncbi:MAG TPA: hypothetical protein VEB18_02895 [Candidatus Paceibacterota bacterium]|nr:hypothetical protein [Candidatus Paceibacterota bacterium]
MTFVDLLLIVFRILNGIVVPLIFLVAFVIFIVGVAQFFFSHNEETRKKGRNFALSGVIGFFLMIAIWGIVQLIVNTFGFNQPNLRPPYFGGGSSFESGSQFNLFPGGSDNNSSTNNGTIFPGGGGGGRNGSGFDANSD